MRYLLVTGKVVPIITIIPSMIRYSINTAFADLKIRSVATEAEISSKICAEKSNAKLKN